MGDKEIRGIYNTTFNEKKATPILKDGAQHIKLYLEKGSQGEITIEELVNIDNSLREYLKKFKEPFIDIERNKTAKLFEWENVEGVRFRVATDKIKGECLPKMPLSPSADTIHNLLL